MFGHSNNSGKNMNFKNRINLTPSGPESQKMTIPMYAGRVFSPVTEGFVVAGYTRQEHMKFLAKVSVGTVYDDAFESPREPLLGWAQAGSELFPNLKGKSLQLELKELSGFPEIQDLDHAVKVFSAVSDAFIFFGYENGQRAIKLYAEDPLMADAIAHLQLLVMSTWCPRQMEAGQ